MKTTFSRTFFPAAIVLLAALALVGLSFQFLARNYMENRSMERLQTGAQTVSDVAAAYYTEEYGSEMDFYINLSVAATAAGADMVICDATGKLVLCSDSPLGCTHQGMVVSQTYLQKVLSAGSSRDTGLVQGLYSDARYVVSVPIRDGESNPVGIVIASAPITDTLVVLRAMSDIYLIVSLLVIVVSVLTMSVLARRQSRPLREMAKAAIAFGHGDLTARVKVYDASPIEVQELAIAFNNMAIWERT